MPAKSEAQRRYLYAHFGAAWVAKHGFNNEGPLPAYVSVKGAIASKQRRRSKRNVHLGTLARLR